MAKFNFRLFMIGVMFDAFVCFVIASIFSFFISDYNKLENTIGIWAGIFFGGYIFAFLFWIKNSIVNWVSFYFLGRRTIEKTLFNFMKDNNLKKPNEYESIEEYYSRLVLEESEISQELKNKILMESSYIGYLLSHQKMQEYLKLSLSFDKAAQKYMQSYNSPERHI